MENVKSNANLSRLIQAYSDLSRLVQTCSDMPKLVEFCLNLFKLDFSQITTCIHNLFSSGTDRWADLYGECQVKCKVNDETTMTCKLEFLKASGYWTSGKKHEVVGSINNSKGM